MNTVVGYFSNVMRGINCVYRHVSRDHLKCYLAEFDFRYNKCAAVSVGDEARAMKLIRGIVGKRLIYKDFSPASVSGVAN
ncbi:MAG: transposase [Methylovirgula sp.]